MSFILIILALGFGISIQTVSVHGIGASTLNDLVFNASDKSFLSHSILEIFIQASGTIFICTTLGQILKPSISTDISNSCNLFFRACALSIRYCSSTCR